MLAIALHSMGTCGKLFAESIETLAAGKKTTITYYAPKRQSQFEVVVRAEPLKKEVSEQVLSVEELKRIPGTQNDAIKAVQNLPGVARAPFGGGLLVVWGSAPADTRVYADGVQLPRIFHFAGFRSTINSEFVEELSFKPGAYGADFGRGLGGMIDVTTRSPKSDRIHGSVTLDLIDGSMTLEGPVTKNLYLAGGVRVSWISVFLPIFNRSQFQVSPFYWDYQLSMRYRPTKADDIDVFIFGSTDNLEARVSDPDPAINIFWLALALIIVGSGFLKANISVMVGQLYRLTDARRDARRLLLSGVHGEDGAQDPPAVHRGGSRDTRRRSQRSFP